MFAALLLTVALAGQSAPRTGIGWDYDETHEGAVYEIEWATTFDNGVLPCTDAVLTPTVDSRCTVEMLREVETSIRLRVSKHGVTQYSDWIIAPPLGQGQLPGVLTITFVGEAAAMVSTTASRRFEAISGTHIVSHVSGATAGNSVGGAANWTYVAWLKLEAAGDGGTVAGVWAENNYQAVLLVAPDGSVQGHTHGNFFFSVQSAAGAITPGAWYLVALRHEGNGFSGILSLWINDVRVHDAATTGPAPVALVPFKIGAHGVTGDALLPFNGLLSSVGVWRSTAVSDQDLQGLRNRYPSNPPGGLTFLTIRGVQDTVVDHIGGMLLANVGSAFSPDGPSGLQP